MFLHNDLSVNEVLVEEEIDGDEDSFRHDDNQCHICHQKIQTKDDLFKHEDYFLGIMEYANNSNQT